MIAGLLLLINRFAPFALTVLAATIVNIIVFDVLVMPKALLVGRSLLSSGFWRHIAFARHFCHYCSRASRSSRYAVTSPSS